jgi:hypothetical protein
MDQGDVPGLLGILMSFHPDEKPDLLEFGEQRTSGGLQLESSTTRTRANIDDWRSIEASRWQVQHMLNA